MLGSGFPFRLRDAACRWLDAPWGQHSGQLLTYSWYTDTMQEEGRPEPGTKNRVATIYILRTTRLVVPQCILAARNRKPP